MSTQLTGTGPQVVAQKLYSSSLEQLHALGELVHTNDGRAFRYVEAGGTALVSGSVYQSQAEDTTNNQNLAVAAAAIGDTTVTTTTTVTVTANEFSGGFMIVTVTPGLGKIYKIKGHPAATTATLALTLEDAIEVALTTVSRIDLVNNPYKDIVIQPTTRTSSVIGVAVAAIAADEFGWLGAGGIHPTLADGALTVGLDVVSSDNVNGAVEVIADVAPELLPRIGRAITGVATAEVGPVLWYLH